ncbi:MAG: pyridoxamine 5'-phosphate oxidase [Candidatus Kapabacteria bacterium]|nr:pyridoxamine 5'-phosphate oxidase [Candidatus Kapabacteria bacterium]
MKFKSDSHNDYGKFKLDLKSIEKNPFEQFNRWLSDAQKADFIDANAMSISTVNADGKPSSRIVLLKQFDENGFVFFTNYQSRKGKDIEVNPNICALFFWDKLERQIRIEGTIEKISLLESEQYYHSRPYQSRIGAWASEQSQILESRFTLIRKVAKYITKYPINPPLPPFWGGYRLIPEYFEFWQGRESRLHDRFSYQKGDRNWEIQRLYP